MGLKIASWLAAITSVAGFFITVYPHGQSLNALQGGLICLTIIFFGYLIYADINDHFKNRQKVFRNDSEINEYMYNWILKGGRVAIFTHDMSWANGQKMKDLLFAKARNNELCICLPKRISLTDELIEYGAEILTYEKLNYIPKSRFTIVNKDRMDACVAVGRRVKEVHKIEEYSVGQHPVFDVAKDLVEIIKRVNSLRG